MKCNPTNKKHYGPRMKMKCNPTNKKHYGPRMKITGNCRTLGKLTCMYSLLDKALLQLSVNCFLLHHMARPIDEIKTPKMAKQEITVFHTQVSISPPWEFLPVVFVWPMLGVAGMSSLVSAWICVVSAWVGVGVCVVSFGVGRTVFTSCWKILCHRTGKNDIFFIYGSRSRCLNR